jgi:hypothetical protein
MKVASLSSLVSFECRENAPFQRYVRQNVGTIFGSMRSFVKLDASLLEKAMIIKTCCWKFVQMEAFNTTDAFKVELFENPV